MIEAYFFGPRIFGANYRELKKGEKRERRRLGGIHVSFPLLALSSLFFSLFFFSLLNSR
jgi:hypothetical protein